MSQQASLEEEKGVYSNPNGMPFADGKNLHMDVSINIYVIINIYILFLYNILIQSDSV